MKDKQKIMINVGGGYFFRCHWKILDYNSIWYNYPKGLIDYNFDLLISKSFPFPTNSVTFYYSSHTLEHIPQEYCQHILNEIFSCLKPAGAVRLTMPDFDLAYKAYSDNNIKFFIKYRGKNITKKFLSFFASYLVNITTSETVKRDFISMNKEEFADYYTLNIPRKTQKIFTGNHINWWNYEKTSKMLKKAGFTKIYQSYAQKSMFS